jgi:acyl carrier protein
MDRTDVRQRILALAAKELKVEPDVVEQFDRDDLAKHLDSVQRLSLVVAIEDAFLICLDPEDEEGLVSLHDVIEVVARKAAS